MLLKIVASSIRFRLNLYIPMLVAITVSLSLIGAAEIVGSSFTEIVNREMSKYGANVILIPEEGVEVEEGVAVYVKSVKLVNTDVSLAITHVQELLKMNPAWIVRGNGSILVGSSVAEQLGINEGDFIEISGFRGRVAILDTGTEFDSFVIVNGSVEEPSMVLIRTENPERYRGMNAIILEEMIRTKYSFLEGIKKLMLYISLISAASSLAAVINLARIDAGSRRREFGVFKALGAQIRTIVKVIFAEFAALSLASGIIGFTSSLVLSWAILTFTAGVSPAPSLKALLYVFATSLAAFSIASFIYVVESKKQDVIDEIRGE